MWGFITSLNDILIPHLKSVFELNYTQAMLVQLCFFGAYFIMGIPAGWLITAVGHKRGIVIALLIMGLGCLLFYPASIVESYPLFLGALFILASGITVLQVAANAYIVEFGKPETASIRLNLSQGFNSLAHTIAPIVGTSLILSTTRHTELSAEAVQVPYLGLAGITILLAVFFAYSKLPSLTVEKEEQDGSKSIWSYPHLMFGAIAIFLYVGAEVSIGSFLVNFFGESNIKAMSSDVAGDYVSYYWGGAMVGRFAGSAILRRVKANVLLSVYCIVNIILIAVTIRSSGDVAMISILAVGFFNSVMFPNIFSLSLKGLGKNSSKGSGILVLAIVGGAIIPLIQGYFADLIGIQQSFFIPMICYALVFFYGIKFYKSSSELKA